MRKTRNKEAIDRHEYTNFKQFIKSLQDLFLLSFSMGQTLKKTLQNGYQPIKLGGLELLL